MLPRGKRVPVSLRHNDDWWLSASSSRLRLGEGDSDNPSTHDGTDISPAQTDIRTACAFAATQTDLRADYFAPILPTKGTSTGSRAQSSTAGSHLPRHDTSPPDNNQAKGLGVHWSDASCTAINRVTD